THRNLLSNARRIADWLRLGPRDRVLTVMPLFHANAIVIGTLVPLCAGASAVIAERFRAAEFWASVDRHRPTTAGTVPTMLALLRIGDGEDPDLPSGAVGEIVLRGAHVMCGYFRAPEATAAAMHGGWLHTGDLGRLDADGFLHIVGRASELIIRGGENVYPR